ncbi:MAG: thioredoxin family protein [Proteobacteria bacterium]|nr:thioredoxin family protein [Pseudomonadota bacterium]
MHGRPAAVSEPVTVGGGRPQLFDFGMGVCSQCKRMKPVMERAARELGSCVEVHVLDIRVEVNEQLAERYGMHAIPFILLVDGAGKELWRHEGFVDYPELSLAVSRYLGLTPDRQCGGDD